MADVLNLDGRLLTNDVPPAPREALVERLVSSGAIDSAAVARAELIHARTGQPLEQVLNQIGVLSDDRLVEAYERVGITAWEPDGAPALEADVVADLPVSIDYLRRHRLLLLVGDEGTRRVAACDPLDSEALEGLAFALGGRVEPLAARPADLRRVFGELFPQAEAEVAIDARRLERDLDQIGETGIEGAGARLVTEVLEAAVAAHASDIHFEPRRNDLRIRLRLDGRLVEHRTVALDLAAPAVSRVKVIAGLDLGERRLPQDGRTSFVVQGRTIDVRVAVSPTVFGEGAVLRLLDRTHVKLDLEALGVTGEPAALMDRAVLSAHGLFLLSGPTGSGKTTTLYALLEKLRDSPRKILSVEDPVEYHFDHVAQTQVQPAIGLTFAHVLRSFLRQDPDVILVGEIRDAETAAVAVQAAMTGHLVLASVHANDAPGVIPRLVDMGVEPYQLAAALRHAAAQRLVRRLCPHCVGRRGPTEREKRLAAGHGVELPRKVAEPVGCPRCQASGFAGRLAIVEAFACTETMARQVSHGAGHQELAQAAAASGYRPMVVDGLHKVVAGLTTVDEVMGALSD